MFGHGVFFVLGKELKDFTVLRPEIRETENGRIINNSYIPACEIKAILAAAKPEEKERWRQLQYPITHKIIQQGISPVKIKAGYIFECEGRKFHIRAEPYNIGGLNYWTIYYCEERGDIYEKNNLFRN